MSSLLKYHTLGEPFCLESGEMLNNVDIAYETWGTLNENKDNAVLILHAFTGDSHVTSDKGTEQTEDLSSEGWWESYVGPGKPIDTNRWFVVSSNVLGGCAGSTGPASTASDGYPYGSRFPLITVRDQVRVEALLADFLEIPQYAFVAGGSMGGMRALEWAIMFPDRVGGVWVGTSSAFATAEQIASTTLQIQTIMLDPNWCNGDYLREGKFPHRGLSLARQNAMISYRTEDEFALRFARDIQTGEDPYSLPTVNHVGTPGHRFEIQSFLDHHGKKITERFDPATYVVLANTMMTHDVGRGRKGVTNALKMIHAPLFVTGVRSDRLYPLRLQRQLVDSVPSAQSLHIMETLQGHDSFLLPDSSLADYLRYSIEPKAYHRTHNIISCS